MVGLTFLFINVLNILHSLVFIVLFYLTETHIHSKNTHIYTGIFRKIFRKTKNRKIGIWMSIIGITLTIRKWECLLISKPTLFNKKEEKINRELRKKNVNSAYDIYMQKPTRSYVGIFYVAIFIYMPVLIVFYRRMYEANAAICASKNA